jgi:deoxyribose-phosphate aldolase
MTTNELARYIDQTLLKPDVNEKDIFQFLEEVKRYPFASVCIPPCYVQLAASLLKNGPTKVGTVIGFPLGYQTTISKIGEAEEAIAYGADEIDMVMNISTFKSGNFDKVKKEIGVIKNILCKKNLKVIIEACYLTDDEKKAACDIIITSGGDYVKTSTGFGPGNATVKDIELLVRQSAGRISVKASGGIKTLSQALSMLEAGANRLGTSSGISILQELTDKE